MLLNHGLALSHLHNRTVLLCNNRLEPLSVNTLELFEKVFGYIKILIWLRSLLVQLLYAYVLVLWRHVKTVVVDPNISRKLLHHPLDIINYYSVINPY